LAKEILKEKNITAVRAEIAEFLGTKGTTRVAFWQPFGFLKKAVWRFDLCRHSRENANPG
jgi:hypothetical protein